jgi:D-inositol-3-phosphate glycosyltransferase
MTQLRIAMISEHVSPLATPGGVDCGGQHTHVTELSRALARRGHEVRVYTRRDREDAVDTSFEDGVTVVHVPVGPAAPLPKDALLPYMGDFGRWLAAHWQDDDQAPDVIHAHFWMSGLAALTATAQSRIPVVVTFHALGSVKRRYLGDKDTSPDTRTGLERTVGTMVNRVIAQSADEVAELGRLGIKRTDTAIVPSGVNIERFTQTGPVAERPPDGRQRILSVGRMVERKGFGDLIQALRRVPDAELVLAGGPPASELATDPEAIRLRALAEQAKVADRVRMVGSVAAEDLAALYRSADVVACTPWYEPFGLTPLEAMACGVPVVAYAVGGLAESVIDRVTGTLVQPRDVRGLGSALRTLLADEVRRMSYASAAADRVRARFTWDRAAFDVERVYFEAAGLVPAEGPLTDATAPS